MTLTKCAGVARKRSLMGFAVACCLGSGLALSGVTPAAASVVVYDFVGSCAACGGMGVGEIVLKDFTPGQKLTAANFVSFTYNSGFGQFSVNSSQLTNFQALLDPENLTKAHVLVGETGATFESTGTGFWSVTSSLSGATSGGGGGGGGGGERIAAESISAPSAPPSFSEGASEQMVSPSLTWADAAAAAVPEPGAWALMIGGLAGAGGLLRSRKRPAPAIEIA
ncbi:MAG TPA: PEP-CTERM sorting domain-containing protein [Phenylobacterium sp.]|jgi:hypothetical protein|uniref:PEP-CTERM sorting domain-containing protein n=1 Tax=Phenylobacterium sp. TaxID=1871053 RepID=UPI002C7E7F1B|nr:PEP-CTERM sorting domain-containing protein [Phenylobacterium sp.]HXA39989.1 PEP-CTERM sorting domain-containing protein [Phenylobacterium sp.]